MFGFRRARSLPINWGDVDEVLAIKEDAFGLPTVSLLFRIGPHKRTLSLQPEIDGHREAIRSIPTHLPGIAPYWHEEMMASDLNNFERFLYRRA